MTIEQPRARLVHGLFIGLALVSFGCGGAREPTLVPVRGQVTYQGMPLVGATISFHPVGQTGARLVYTISDEQGRYQFTHRKPGDGVPAGDYAVTVVLLEQRRDGDDMVATGRNLLPDRYARPETSALTVKVAPGAEELPPLALTRP